MGVIMQAFYWDCPSAEGKEQAWWGRVEDEVAALAQTGFTALWLPPAGKAAEQTSMGYDPYDYFDLGEFDQKGGVPTWFGTRAALESLIAAAHDRKLQVYADFVINHCSGADAQEPVPLDGNQLHWTKFTPKSGRFPRDWECFHPSRYEIRDASDFSGMPDLCHRNPKVYEGLLDCAAWLLGEIGYDGFRFDFVKGYGPWMVRAIQELGGLRDDASFAPFSVGEFWDTEHSITAWLDGVNALADNPVSAFDFPLRWNLQALCGQFGYSLRGLLVGSVVADRPDNAVTFVENHDVVRTSPIIADKMLAYAVILTHPGYPCVFWQDYFTWGLGLPGEVGGIAALVGLHESHAGGAMTVLYCDDDLYVMQRGGTEGQPGLVFVLNNRGDWNGTHVTTRWAGTHMVPAAWRSASDLGIPVSKWTDGTGACDVWAPPRGYVVYVPG